jgi:uncharacterized membrane protein YbaN (DUF454 family)
MANKSKIQIANTPAFVRYGYLILGVILAGIGFLGIFLPLLPTTIFLILASACFMRSSPQANEWLRNHKWLGAYLRNYQDKTGLTIKSKIIYIVILWLSIGFSAMVLTNDFGIQVILFIIAVGVTLHLITIKTQKEE